MPRAFISYVKEDFDDASRIAAVLRQFGIEVWLDRTSLKPGLRWQAQIRQAIATSDFFIACFSELSTNRHKTFMNEELVLAIEELRTRSKDRAWLIPLKLSECQVPDWSIGMGETLRSIQWIDASTDWTKGIEGLLSVIVPGSERLLALIEQLSNKSARRRVEAIESLGELGHLAEYSLGALVDRIDAESESNLGLLPLAALREALVKLDCQDQSALDRIDSALSKAGVTLSVARKSSHLASFIKQIGLGFESIWHGPSDFQESLVLAVLPEGGRL